MSADIAEDLQSCPADFLDVLEMVVDEGDEKISSFDEAFAVADEFASEDPIDEAREWFAGLTAVTQEFIRNN